MKNLLPLFILVLFFNSCETPSRESIEQDAVDYYSQEGRDDVLSGGVKLIPIKTDVGTFNVWTKRTGNNPKMKLLLVHGGPGATHEYFECFDAFFPGEGIEYYYYDQLESYYSDKPSNKALWTVDRYVDEVEQVRKALGLNKDNFYLLGHSWGGILGMEYALKYPDQLKGLIISNMVASIPEYIKYANEVLGPKLDPDVLKRIKDMEAKGEFTNPEYGELVATHYYPKHVLRMPLEDWPDPVNRAFANINGDLYLTMQGPSEFGIVGDAKIKNWDRSKDLKNIKVPSLCIGGAHDTMDPKYMEWMSTEIPKGRYLHCPNGSHMAMYDDQNNYFEGLVKFMRDVDDGEF